MARPLRPIRADKEPLTRYSRRIGLHGLVYGALRMIRKMKALRSAPSHRPSSQRHWSVADAPRVDEPLPLICGVCGASGKYDVGTVTLDPVTAKSRDRDAIERATGFTAYFRCRACDAGGPWKLPAETEMYITAMSVAALIGIDDVPLVLGATVTFDGHVMRYATDSEAYLKKLIDREPERAFLWVRLGNLYSHTQLPDRARPAYERAIELDPKDIEAHSMLGQLLVNTGRLLDAVPHWHAVLKHVRDARHLDKELRREIVRDTIECLLEAHAESNEQIKLLPDPDPAELNNGRQKETAVVELREFDLSTEEGLDELCGLFLGQQRRRGQGLLQRRKNTGRSLLKRPNNRLSDTLNDWMAESRPLKSHTVGRNDRCPCGSGRKYKKCCGR